MIAGKVELCSLFPYGEIMKFRLRREFIAETKAIVEEPETNHNAPVTFRFLFEYDGQLIVAVWDDFLFTPNRCPCCVDHIKVCADDGKSIHQRCLVFQFKTETA